MGVPWQDITPPSKAHCAAVIETTWRSLGEEGVSSSEDYAVRYSLSVSSELSGRHHTNFRPTTEMDAMVQLYLVEAPGVGGIVGVTRVIDSRHPGPGARGV